MAGCIGNWFTSVCEILLALPSGLVKPLQKISLPVKQADPDQRNIQVGCALDVVAGQHAQAAGVNRQRFVQSEFGGKISDRPRPQHARIGRAPGAVRVQILLLAAVDIVDAAVQHQFRRAPLDLSQRHLAEQGDGILIELPPAGRIQIAKQADAVVVPAPPDVARQRP